VGAGDLVDPPNLELAVAKRGHGVCDPDARRGDVDGHARRYWDAADELELEASPMHIGGQLVRRP